MPANETMVRDRAQFAGVEVDTYSPGDGRTRYRFFKPHSGASYFGHHPSEVLATVLGAGLALTWLDGYYAGKSVEREACQAARLSCAEREAVGQ